MNPAVTGAIVGARSPEQVDENVGSMGHPLSRDTMDAVENALKAAFPEE
jgi:aryl-alcohol dehydrogenase-like predicted oxidoreductase